MMWVLVMSCARMSPLEASSAHILSLGMGPGMPRAMQMSQCCSSMSFLQATGRSFMPGTVTLMILNPVPVFWSSSMAAFPMSYLAKVVSAIPMSFIVRLPFP